jgi:hypothetical protein
MSLKLNQVLAIEKGEKNRAHSAITQLHKTAQKADLYNGFTKTYVSVDEEGETFPNQRQIVRVHAERILEEVTSSLSELFDIEATKDYANTRAKADVVVDGVTLLVGAPPTYLLFLEKQLADLHTFVTKMPTLDDAEDWTKDSNGMYRTDVAMTQKTRKDAKVLVKYEATKEHPAQTEIIGVDKVVGHWHTTKLSGALAAPRKKKLLERIIALSKAVKQAREEANMTECEKEHVAEGIFGYLFE